MKRTLLVATLALATVAAFVAGCGDSGKPSGGNGGGEDKISRPEPTGEYKGKTNPNPDAPDAVAEGKKLFDTNCVTCHGPNGDGDSPTGKALPTPASNLTDAKLQDAVKDDYLYWHIAEGSAVRNLTGMTPYKDQLKEEQIWQLVAYIRSIKK